MQPWAVGPVPPPIWPPLGTKVAGGVRGPNPLFLCTLCGEWDPFGVLQASMLYRRDPPQKIPLIHHSRLPGSNGLRSTPAVLWAQSPVSENAGASCAAGAVLPPCPWYLMGSAPRVGGGAQHPPCPRLSATACGNSAACGMCAWRRRYNVQQPGTRCTACSMSLRP